LFIFKNKNNIIILIIIIIDNKRKKRQMLIKNKDNKKDKSNIKGHNIILLNMLNHKSLKNVIKINK